MNPSLEYEYLLQRDNLDWLTNRLGSEQTVTVAETFISEFENRWIACELIPAGRVDEALERSDRGTSSDGLMPRCFRRDGRDGLETLYRRFGNDEGYEPLVIYRDFHDLKPPYFELLEEFRLFHNLCCEKLPERERYTKILDDDADLEVSVVERSKVRIRLRELRQFLALKEMHLAIYFDIRRYSLHSLDGSSERDFSVETPSGRMVYSLWMRPTRGLPLEPLASFSRLFGKKLIPPLPKARSGLWPYSENGAENYIQFLLGEDENGNDIAWSCDPHGFGDAPTVRGVRVNYLTPVFFRREVLLRYYDDPTRYGVEDNLIRCGSRWALEIDNNHEDYVVAFLGDLGRDLPENERRYWRSHNVTVQGAMSQVSQDRFFLAEFRDPEALDHKFKLTLERFQLKWLEVLGWHLFRPLPETECHLVKTLRIPLNNSPVEFDAQVLALTKILIDSLNDSRLKKELGSIEAGAKSIEKLEAFLQEKGFSARQDTIQFLKDLQRLRSKGSAHLKGTGYENALSRFAEPNQDLREVFASILNQAVRMLEALSDHFLT